MSARAKIGAFEFIFFLGTVCAMCQPVPCDTSLSILTFNLRYDYPFYRNGL